MEQPETIIEAGRTDRQYWRDLWRYRELFYYLAWRDLIVRYKQTVVGVAWAVVRPLLTTIILAFAFGKVAKLSSGSVPYPLFVFVGQLAWQFFSSALNDASSSLVGSSSLITKIYFPRLIIPTATIIPCVVDTLISAVLLAGMMVWYGSVPTWHVVFAPLFGLLAFASSMGLGLWMAALTVKYRDFKYITGFGLQFGLYVSPVAFDSNYVPEAWRPLYALNPMVGVIDGFRWALFDADRPMYWPGVWISVAVTAFLVWGGLRHFRNTERSFADTI
jgi:lipopolysaccharide transport system permease protein